MTKYEPVLVRNSRINDFVDLPYRLYKGNAYWVPPLKGEVRAKIDPGKNPFFEYGEVSLAGVVDGHGKLVGRAAAIKNPLHNGKHGDRAGFFGMFECIDDTHAALVLMDSVKAILKKWGCDRVMGPVNFTTNEESGFLVDGFDSRPVFMTNYCFPYYRKLMEETGFAKKEDLLSYGWSKDHVFLDGFEMIARRAENGAGVSVRRIDRSRMDEELLRIRAIYNKSFDAVGGFVPMTEGEVNDMGKAFRLVADDDLILFAERWGRTVGFCLSLPDVNELLYGLKGNLFPFGFARLAFGMRNIRSLRLLVLCVDPECRMSGIAALLIRKLHETGIRKGYEKGELAVVLESNSQMRKILGSLGFTAVKRYRIYESAIRKTGGAA